MRSSRNIAVILAAGAGTRMRSSLPKPLHPVAGIPMLGHVVRAVRSAGVDEVIVVASPAIQRDERWREFTADVAVTLQDEPLGTGHALQSALPSIGQADTIVVAFADHPLLLSSSLDALISARARPGVRCVLLTCVLDDAAGYGRIDRDDVGRVVGIVERKDDEPSLRAGRTEVNSGMMALDAAWAREAVMRLKPSPTTGELYLTELVRMAVDDGPSDHWPVASVEGSPEELVGINDRLDLARADSLLRGRICDGHMRSGVTLIGGESIMIDADVAIGADTTIYPGSLLFAGTTIGTGCVIGPDAVIERSAIGDRCVVRSSYVVDSTMEAESDVGPYSHVRGGSRIGERVHVGNFAELKRALVEPDVRIGHVSYVGDATVGARTNIGAGTVTCNFDGVDKHETVIGADVFVGSDSMLVAPITLGDGSATGAGSVVTKDVPPGTTVVGIPARPIGTTRRRTTGDQPG